MNRHASNQTTPPKNAARATENGECYREYREQVDHRDHTEHRDEEVTMPRRDRYPLNGATH